MGGEDDFRTFGHIVVEPAFRLAPPVSGDHLAANHHDAHILLDGQILLGVEHLVLLAVAVPVGKVLDQEHTVAPGVLDLLGDKRKLQLFQYRFPVLLGIGEDQGIGQVIRAQGLEGPGHFHLGMSQVVAGDTGKDLLVQGVMQAVDLPVFREQDPVRRLDQVEFLGKMGGLDIGDPGQTQGAKRIERDYTHRKVQLAN